MTETEQRVPEFMVLYHEQSKLTPGHTKKYIKDYDKRWEVDARRNIVKYAKQLLDIIGSLPEEYFDYVEDGTARGFGIATPNIAFMKPITDGRLVPSCQIATPAGHILIFEKDNETVICVGSEVYGFRHSVEDFDTLPAEYVVYLYDRILTALGVAVLLDGISKKGTK